jgi:hypothetical protein
MYEGPLSEISSQLERPGGKGQSANNGGEDHGSFLDS